MCTCIDWTAVSAVVSAIMTFATFCTLYFSRKQLNEMRRQWDEDRRPRLFISIISTDDHFIFKVENVGKEIARNVKFKFNSFLKEKSLTKSMCEYFKDIEDKVCHISPCTSKYFFILPTFGFGSVDYSNTGEHITEADLHAWIEENLEESINMSCSYLGGSSRESYTEVFNTQLKNLFNKSARVVDDEVGAILAINSTLKAVLKYYKRKEQDKRAGF